MLDRPGRVVPELIVPSSSSGEGRSEARSHLFAASCRYVLTRDNSETYRSVEMPVVIDDLTTVVRRGKGGGEREGRERSGRMENGLGSRGHGFQSISLDS